VARQLAIATTQPSQGQAEPGEQESARATMPASAAQSTISAPTTLGVESELIDVVIYVLADPAGTATQPSTQPTDDVASPAVDSPAAPLPSEAPTTAATQGSSPLQ
jgi:hypothetical protein